MSKKSIYWGILLLLFFPAVVTADYFDKDDDADSGDETAVEENFGNVAETAVEENAAKTWKHTMSVSLKNRKAVSPDNEIQVDTDSDIETGSNGKDFWKVEDAISFSFHLPYKARVRVKCALNDKYTGEVLVKWNGKALRDENGKRKEFTFDGSNASFEIPNFETDRKENNLTLVCADGEIGLESLTIYADIEYPSFEFNGMVIQLTSPRPGAPLDGNPVSICWEVTRGLAAGGWVKVLYRTPDTDWQVVPGLEGVTYGAENWGVFIWENPPKAKTSEFKIEYTRGENPVDIQHAQEEQQHKAITAAAKELIQAKKSFLDDVGGLLPSSIWKKYLNEMRSDHQTLKAKLKKSLKDENNLNLREVVQNIDALEQCYFTAFTRLMKIAPTIEDEKERNDIQAKVDEFEEMLAQEFSNAREDYGEDEYTKELLPKMFPKERFVQFKAAKKEFDNALELLNPKPGMRRVESVNGVEFAFRWCPAGTFTMGSPESEEGRNNNEKQYQVTLTKGFWMMETEVTQKQWKAVMGNNPSKFKGDDLPVETVSWKDCREFCKKCTELGLPVQLPTEAQWEYACRAGSTTAYFWGNALNGDKANCDGRYPCGTTTKGKCLAKASSVGSYQPNAWGLYDMHGNVFEWCQDWYVEEYSSGSLTDPLGPSSGFNRVSRGGSWGGRANICRSAFREGFPMSAQHFTIGFRVVRGQ